MNKTAKEVTLQEIVDSFHEGGITDLEIKIFNDGHIEIGYWSFSPVTLLKVEDGKVKDCIFSRPIKPSDYFNAPKEKQVIIFNNLKWVWDLIDRKVLINLEAAKDIKNVVNIFYEVETDE